MPPRLDPEERRARRLARNRVWTAAHHDERLAYWRRRTAEMSTEERERRRIWQRNYYYKNKDKYRKTKQVYQKKHRIAIKVRRILGVSMKRARQLLEARP